MGYLAKGDKMKAVLKVGAIVLLASSLLGQTAATPRKAARKSAAAASASDVQALKEAVAAQQQQLQQVQQAASDAQQKAASLESSFAQKDAVDKLSSQFADVQTTLTNSAVSTQDEQKRVSALESTLGRFRWTGDVRVRGEDFFQTYSGCTACADRNRARIRVRF